MARRLVSFCAAVLFLPRLAFADCGSPDVSACVSADTLWPHAGPLRFASIGGTETVGAGRVGFGLVSSYIHKPIMIHSASPAPNGSDRPVVENAVGATFLFAYGLTNRFELDLAVPMTLGQNGSGTSAVSGSEPLTNTAARDLRFGFTYTLIPRDRVFSAYSQANPFAVAARFEVLAPTGTQSGQFSSEQAGAFLPSIAVDYRRRKWFGGAELGMRIRPDRAFVGTVIGTQMVAALGVGFDILPRDQLSVMVEARMLPTFAEQRDITQSSTGALTAVPNGQTILPAEWSIGLRTAPLAGGDLAFVLAAGGPFATGVPATVPVFRLTLGIVFGPLSRDSDSDGIPDTKDECPLTKGVRNAPDGPGCPVSQPLPPPLPDPPKIPQLFPDQ